MSASTSSTDPRFAWREIPHLELPRRSARERLADFLEVYGLYDEVTAQAQAARCIQCPDPGCVTGCPLCNPIPDWMRLTAEGRFDEAAALLGSVTGVAEICARLCPGERLCEETCILNGRSEPVAIRHLEQFLMERALSRDLVPLTTPPPLGKTVAVLGSGPGGLACADELAGLGYSVTVFDTTREPGGSLLATLPGFRMEKAVIQRRVAAMGKRGVRFETGRNPKEKWDLDELRQTFDAVYIGFDARRPKPLQLPGADLPGVCQALDFLVKTNSAPAESAAKACAGKRVVVIGAGDTAVDCARTAARCGARQTTVFYRREESDMPCTPHEYATAVEEGVGFIFCAAPVGFTSNAGGQLAGVQFVRTRVPADQPGPRRGFEPLAGTEIEVETDLAMLAVGFDARPVTEFGEWDRLTLNERGGIVVDAANQTSVPGIFAGGDLSRGPSSVLYSVRDARRAARGIHQFLLPSLGTSS